MEQYLREGTSLIAPEGHYASPRSMGVTSRVNWFKLQDDSVKNGEDGENYLCVRVWVKKRVSWEC